MATKRWLAYATGGKVAGLAFEPPIYRAGVQAVPLTAKLFRQYSNGSSDDVSNDPNLKVTDREIGGRQCREGRRRLEGTPKAPGMTKVTATLDGQTAEMAIEINGSEAAGAVITGQPVGIPSTLSLWSGETQAMAMLPSTQAVGRPLFPSR